MFFTFSKLVAFLTNPLGWCCLLLFCAVLVSNLRLKKRLRVAALLLFYFMSCDFFINELSNGWEAKPTNRATMPAYEVGVLLTGGILNETKEPLENSFLGKHADRLGQTLLLYREQKIKKIIISGGDATIFRKERMTEGQLAKLFLVKCGVPAEAIQLEEKSRNTYENARYTAPLLSAKSPALLITSAVHLPRAVACFEEFGCDVVGYGCDYSSHSREWQLSSFLPSEQTLYEAKTLFHELLGYGIYKIFYLKN